MPGAEPKKSDKVIQKKTLPWNVQSFLREKVYVRDHGQLMKIKQLMSTKKPKKPKVSHYNQDVMR